MEFRTLRYFIAIADAGSITTAADILHVTQPTLSGQMKELEEELGKKLFSRAKKGSRRLELTEEGLILRRRADEILEIVRKTELEISSEGGAVKGDVYIGMGEAGSLERIIRIIDSIQAEHPGIRFHFYSGNAEDIEYRIGRGLLDFGIIFGRKASEGFSSLTINEKEVWGVLMRFDSPLAALREITPRNLMEKPLVISEQAGFLHRLLKWAGSAFEKFQITATYNLINNASLMAKSGGKYVIGYGSIINTENSGLAFRPLSPEISDNLSIIWKGQPLTKAAAVFLDKMKESFEEDSVC